MRLDRLWNRSRLVFFNRHFGSFSERDHRSAAQLQAERKHKPVCENPVRRRLQAGSVRKIELLKQENYTERPIARAMELNRFITIEFVDGYWPALICSSTIRVIAVH